MAHWIIVDDTEHFTAKCSVCGYAVDTRLLHCVQEKYRRCFKCNSIMDVEEREEGWKAGDDGMPDIKGRVRSLTEREAKVALAWILETMEEWHMGCINDIGVNCPLWMQCGNGKNHCPNAWLDEGLKKGKL